MHVMALLCSLHGRRVVLREDDSQKVKVQFAALMCLLCRRGDVLRENNFKNVILPKSLDISVRPIRSYGECTQTPSTTVNAADGKEAASCVCARASEANYDTELPRLLLVLQPRSRKLLAMPWKSMKPTAQTGAASQKNALNSIGLSGQGTTEVNGPLYRPDPKLTGVSTLIRPDDSTSVRPVVAVLGASCAPSREEVTGPYMTNILSEDGVAQPGAAKAPHHLVAHSVGPSLLSLIVSPERGVHPERDDHPERDA
jgi:hypothetical protein